MQEAKICIHYAYSFNSFCYFYSGHYYLQSSNPVLSKAFNHTEKSFATGQYSIYILTLGQFSLHIVDGYTQCLRPSPLGEFPVLLPSSTITEWGCVWHFQLPTIYCNALSMNHANIFLKLHQLESSPSGHRCELRERCPFNMEV